MASKNSFQGEKTSIKPPFCAIHVPYSVVRFYSHGPLDGGTVVSGNSLVSQIGESDLGWSWVPSIVLCVYTPSVCRML